MYKLKSSTFIKLLRDSSVVRPLSNDENERAGVRRRGAPHLLSAVDADLVFKRITTAKEQSAGTASLHVSNQSSLDMSYASIGNHTLLSATAPLAKGSAGGPSSVRTNGRMSFEQFLKALQVISARCFVEPSGSGFYSTGASGVQLNKAFLKLIEEYILPLG